MNVCMLFKPLPDPENAELLRGYLWDADTIVVHDRAESAVYGRHIAPLSVKLVRSGSERYNVHGFHEAVCPADFLVINEGQPYESLIDSVAPVETMCVFFSRQDVLDVERRQLADAALVDEPDAEAPCLEFPAVKRRADPELRRSMDAIPALCGAPTLARNEFSVRLLSALIDNDRPSWRTSEKVDALRPSTRRELYRRCLIGRAYIDAAFETDIALADVARAARLSRAHFLRSFKQCFGQTPYQVLRQRRLEHAVALLEAGSASITEVALSVGYNNFSAFTRAFRSVHGVPPSAYPFVSSARNTALRP